VSKQSNLSLEEKVNLVGTYDLEDLHYILKDFEAYPKHYDKAVIIEVINKLFENGITSI
jgi:hypothetical protein